MERKALFAAFLCMAILVAYQEYIHRYYPPTKTQEPVTAPAAPVPATPVPVQAPERGQPPAAAEKGPAGTEERIVIETGLYRAVLSTRGGRMASFVLKSYRNSIQETSLPVEMIQAGNGIPFPIGVELVAAKGERTSDAEVYYEGNRSRLTLEPGEEGTIRLTGKTAGGTRISKEFIFSGSGYGTNLKVALSALPAQTRQLGLLWTSTIVSHKPNGYRSQGVEGLALQGRKLRREKPEEVSPPKTLAGEIRWAGVGDEYFLSAMAPAEGRLGDARFRMLEGEPGAIETGLMLDVAGDGGVEEEFTLYVGPKHVGTLNLAGHGFQRAVDFGWFSTLALAALWLLEKLHTVTGNYGVDIILLTMMIKVVFVPLTHKSTKSMRDMQKLQPQMARLKEKFKDDRDRLNKEMMALYKRHGVNPLGGCLPMLLQFPVFIALYQVLGHSIQLRHAPFGLWIRDLAASECYLPAQVGGGCNLLPLFGFPVPGLVILMGLTMILQQWITPATAGTDPTQQRMMMLLLPLIFTVMFVSFPTGLVLYWLVNNILTVAQQWVTNRYVTT